MNAMQTMEAVNMFVSILMALVNANAEVATNCPVTAEVALVSVQINIYLVDTATSLLLTFTDTVSGLY